MSFEVALELPPFKREELEDALLEAEDAFGVPNPLVVALHTKLGIGGGKLRADARSNEWEKGLRKVSTRLCLLRCPYIGIQPF
jgi:hypothetical protein